MSKSKLNASLYSYLLVIAFFIGLLFANMVHYENAVSPLANVAHTDLVSAEGTYLRTRDTRDLVNLIKSLAYHQEIMLESVHQKALACYGQELLDRTREQSLDLEDYDTEAVMLELLRIVRRAGAR